VTGDITHKMAPGGRAWRRHPAPRRRQREARVRHAMGKASRAKRDGTRREKIAAQRARERRAEIRNRLLIASGSVVVIIAIVAVFIVVKVNGKPAAAAASNGPVGTALANVVSGTTSVAGQHARRGRRGQCDQRPDQGQREPADPERQAGDAVRRRGSYCPYCAAQRWAMVVALSRFGTFIRAAHRALLQHRRPSPTRRTVHLPRVQLHQQVPVVHAGRDADQHPGQELGLPATPRCSRPRPPSRP